MEYISTKEAAARWGVSERLVQRYCIENRILGAKKFGHYWMIPAGAEKPPKHRQKEVPKTSYDSLFPIDDASLVCLPGWQAAGEAEQVLSTLSGESARLFETGLAYYRGQVELACKLARTLLEDAQYYETRIACLQVLALCAVYRGNYVDWTEVLQRILSLPSWRAETDALKELAIASVRLSFLDLSTVPDWLKSGDFERLPESGSFQAVFVHIKCLQVAGKLEVAKHAVKMALTRPDFRSNPAVRSYFELILAHLTHALNEDEAAKVHIRTALTYILPDNLYGILIENVGWVDSLLEEVMVADGLEEEWRSIMRLYETFKVGWIKLGQQIIGGQWVVDLTPREWETLKFATLGLSSSEISTRMCISVASVKKYLGTVYDKLSISGRTEIKSLLPLVGSGESDKK